MTFLWMLSQRSCANSFLSYTTAPLRGLYRYLAAELSVWFIDTLVYSRAGYQIISILGMGSMGKYRFPHNMWRSFESHKRKLPSYQSWAMGEKPQYEVGFLKYLSGVEEFTLSSYLEDS